MMLKNYFRAGIGGAGSQLINFFALPIISRLYTPDEYAGWALVIAVATILGTIASLRFELAIVLPDNEYDANSIFWGGLFTALTIILCTSAGFTLLASEEKVWGKLIQIDAGVPFPVLVGFLAFVFAVYHSLQYWHIRHQRYTINSIAQVILAGVTISGQVGWTLAFQSTSVGLMFGTAIGQLAGIITLLVGVSGKKQLPFLNQRIVCGIPSQFKKWRRFPLYSTPYTLFGVLRDRAALLIIEIFASTTQVGLYAFAFRIMNFPVALISNSLRPVMFQVSASQGVKSIEMQIYKMLRLLIVFSMPILVIYFFIADKIFLWFFGPEWVQAGHIGKFIIFPIYTFMLVNWMDRIMDVLGQQRTTLVLEIVFATFSILALLGGFQTGMGLEGALEMQALVLVLYNITYLIVAYDKARYDKTRLLYLLGYGAVSATFSLTVVMLVRFIF